MVSSILFPPHHQFSRGTAACAVKKHSRYEFRFTLRSSSTHCPIKKLCLRGSRSSRTYCSSAVRVFIIIIIIIIVVIFVAQTSRHRAIFVSCCFEGRNETNDGREGRRVQRLRSDRDVAMRRKKCASIREWTNENGTRRRGRGESVKKMKIRRMLRAASFHPPPTYVLLQSS